MAFTFRALTCSPELKFSSQPDIERYLDPVDQKIKLLIPAHLSDNAIYENEFKKDFFTSLSRTIGTLDELFAWLTHQEKSDLLSLVDNKNILAEHLFLVTVDRRLNVAALRALLEIAKVVKKPLTHDLYQPKEEDKLGYHVLSNKVAILVLDNIDKGALRKVNNAKVVNSGRNIIQSKVSCDKIGARNNETGDDYILGVKEELEALKTIHTHFKKSHPGAPSSDSRIMDDFVYTTISPANKICSFGEKMFGNGNLLFQAPEFQKLNALIDIGIGLQTVAEAGFIHNDFKLPNCLLNKDPMGQEPIVVKVIDFGLSCPVGTPSNGTPDAEPPESAINSCLYKGKGYDAWSYAVAALEMMQECNDHTISNIMMDFLTLCKKEWVASNEDLHTKLRKIEIHRNNLMITIKSNFLPGVKKRAEFPSLIDEKFFIIKMLMRHNPYKRISCINASNMFKVLRDRYFPANKVM